MIELTRGYRFSASHRLHAPSLSEEENRELYGKCNNPFGHGHNYLLEVTARGPVNQETGTLLPVSSMDALVRQCVLSDFDMSNLNDSPAFSGARVPTTEILVEEIDRRLRQRWAEAFPGGGPWLHRVRVRETHNNS